MKWIFRFVIMLVLCMPIRVMAQEQDEGIQFDKSLSWKEVVEKATRENKYIYVDVMATWCGPCQAMIKNVFTRKEAGDFYNKNFICVKLQTDKTANDSDYVKAWYKEVDDICTGANIKVLPTSLYYNPRGEMVHVVLGGIPHAEGFVAVGKMALDENQQIFSRLKKYEAGERDVEFLYDLSVAFLDMADLVTARKVGNTFWQTITPEERVSEKGIRYANDFFSDVDDSMFSLFMDHPDEVNAVLGTRVAEQKVMEAIEKEYITPLMKDSVNIPDWDGIYQDLSMKYPKKQSAIKEMLLQRKCYYGKRFHNDALCTSALKEQVLYYGAKGDVSLTREYALELGRKTQNKEESAVALEWLERTLNPNDATQLLDNAEIFFLNKQKGKGLKRVNAALKLVKEGSETYEKAMTMKKNNAREMKVLKKIVEEIN